MSCSAITMGLSTKLSTALSGEACRELYVLRLFSCKTVRFAEVSCICNYGALRSALLIVVIPAFLERAFAIEGLKCSCVLLRFASPPTRQFAAKLP